MKKKKKMFNRKNKYALPFTFVSNDIAETYRSPQLQSKQDTVFKH